MQRIEINVATGEKTFITLSDKEVEALQNMPKPPIAVREIDARKLRLALLQLGHLSTVTSAISSLGEAAIIDWEYATIIREDYPLVLALASNLNLDTKAIFDLASSLG